MAVDLKLLLNLFLRTFFNVYQPMNMSFFFVLFMYLHAIKFHFSFFCLLLFIRYYFYAKKEIWEFRGWRTMARKKVKMKLKKKRNMCVSTWSLGMISYTRCSKIVFKIALNFLNNGDVIFILYIIFSSNSSKEDYYSLSHLIKSRIALAFLV